MRSGSITIKRDDVDRRLIDYSDVGTRRRLPPVHPGEFLRNEFLTPMGLSVYELANAIKVPRSRANDIVHGRRAITTDTALRLARYFGTTAEFWMNLQARHDLDVAERGLRRRIEGEGRAAHLVSDQRGKGRRRLESPSIANGVLQSAVLLICTTHICNL